LTSRVAALPQWAALAALALLAGIIAYGVRLPDVTRPDPHRPPPSRTDMGFYRRVVARVRAGEPYEAAAVTEQRAEHYALRPFLTVRPPWLAEFLAWLPRGAASRVMAVLALAVIGAWMVRLWPLAPGPAGLAWSGIGLACGVGWAFFSKVELSLIHEAWAGLLIALSLALRSERRFGAAVLVGLLAALIRELAMPYLLVMAAIALVDKKRGEALAFAATLAIALLALAWHAHALAPLIRSTDKASKGWLALGGWPFVLSAARWNVLILLAGQWLAAILVPLALLGAAARNGPLATRLAILLAGYLGGFLIFGRPENYYWGFIIAPLIGAGVVLAPPAIVDLIRAAARRPRLAPA
jgi:hypothetical protein